MATSRMLLHKDSVASRHPRSRQVEEFIAHHGMTLLAAARRHSGNSADADDAYQRTLEVLLTKAPEGDDQRLLAWALTVVKNEALQEHRRNAKLVGGAADEIDEALSRGVADTHEQVEDVERIGQGREALQRIKPDQMRCLLLRADGLDYDEIRELTGFSYAKVNRCLSEGRKSFRDRVARLDSGAECRRLDGVLSMMADGEASEDARNDALLHLQNCGACQATLREYTTAPSKAAILMPVGLLALRDGAGRAGGVLQRLGETVQSAFNSLQEKLFGHAATLQQGGEVATAKKVAALAAVSASLVAGGVGVHQITQSDDAPKATQPAADAKPFVIAPVKRRNSTDSARRRAKARRARAVRDATTADADGESAGTQVVNPGAPADVPAGTSVPSDQFDSSAPVPAGQGGKSDTSTGLAP